MTKKNHLASDAIPLVTLPNSRKEVYMGPLDTVESEDGQGLSFDEELSIGSLHSMERTMKQLRVSQEHDRWSTNLMEESMPGLVSFSQGSFTSDGVHTSDAENNESISSLESLSIPLSSSTPRVSRSRNSSTVISVLTDDETNESLITPDSSLTRSMRSNVKNHHYNEDEIKNNILSPVARVTNRIGHSQSERRWSRGSVHQSSDTLPTFNRKSSERILCDADEQNSIDSRGLAL